jgi:hypothetical protein
LPGRPRVQPDGRLRFDASFTTIAAELALPLLVVIANVAAPFWLGIL